MKSAGLIKMFGEELLAPYVPTGAKSAADDNIVVVVGTFTEI